MGKSKELAELGQVVSQVGNQSIFGDYSAGSEIVVKRDQSQGSNLNALKPTGSDTIQIGPAITMQTVDPIYAVTQQIGANGELHTFNFSQTYGWNKRMTMDAAGRVTMPYQPTVRCRIANASYGGVYAGAGVSSLHIDTNFADFVRGGMALSGDRVTVPVDGIYYCSAAQLNSMDGGEYMRILVNGSTVHHGYKAISGLGDMHTMAVLGLSANDYVQISYDSSTVDRWQGAHSVFNLFLIG